MPRKTSSRITIDQLAELLGLPSYDDVEEMNFEYIADASRGIVDENEAMEAEDAARQELFDSWRHGVLAAAEHFFSAHGLELAPIDSHTFEIVPITTWEDAAERIRETIEGVGTFYFGSLQEFLRSGPYTPREAVLTHLHWIKRYADVYGGPSADIIYRRAWL